MSSDGHFDRKSSADGVELSTVSARGGVVSGRVLLVLAVSLTLAVVSMVAIYMMLQNGRPLV